MSLTASKVDYIFQEPLNLFMGQIIQEWTKKILWKTAFKKFEGLL